MKKHVSLGMLLMLVLAGCTGTTSSSGKESSKVSTSSSSSVISSSTSSSSVTSSSSSTSSSTNTSSSSSSTDRVYDSTYTVDTEKYPYAKSIGVSKDEVHNAYQILVYSFNDSNGDGYGDLKGVEQKLDYIKELGNDIIWLSPIMPSESYHAYDVLSFYDIDSKLGTLDDYVSLVNEAHKRNMKIMLDMPINHTSTNHEWFKGYLNGEEKYQNYYQEKVIGKNYGTSSAMGAKATFYIDFNTRKTYFAAFGESMPDLNYQSEDLVNAIKHVFKYWVELGADGFRFDAVKHIYDPNEIEKVTDSEGKDITWETSIRMNNELFQELGDYLKEISPDLYMLGENYSGNYEVKQYAETFDSEFDFETWHTALGAVTNKDPWGGSAPRSNYDDTVVGVTNELIAINPNWVATGMTGNHDTTRAASYIGSRVQDLDASLKLYASMLMLRSGIPFIYYGDELGMFGENKSGDNFVEDSEVRMPMPFKDSTIDLKKMFYSKVVDNATGEVNNLGANVLKDWPTYKEDNPVVEEEILDENSLYNTYKSLIAFRSEHPAIYKGTMSLVKDFTNGTIYKMNYNDETLYIAFNFGVNKTTLNNLSSSLDLKFSVNDAKVEGSNLVLPARGACVFKANEINLEFETTVETNSSGNTGSNVAPTEGYALLVTPGNGGSNYYVALTPVDEFEGFQQHMADDISLKVGDTFVLYDCTNQVSWVEDTLSQYGQYQKFSVTENGIRCNEDGIYDIYVKFKWEADEIYIGDMNGA